MAIFINLITNAAGDPAIVQGSVVTADATPTTALTIPLADNSSVFIEASVAARFQGGSGQGGWVVQGTFFRTGGGGATLQGIAPIEQYTEKSVASLDVELLVSSNDVIVEVTGIALQDWTWTVRALVLVAQG